MPPIPIYSESPINGDTADGVTPKTAAGQPPKNDNVPAAAATSSISSARYAPPPPQPGAAPSLPEPTGVSYAPTTTAKTPQYSPPPPPQPGAVPVPPRTSSQAPLNHQSPPQPQQTAPPTLPPPPKAGETLAATTTATTTATAPAAAITAMPPQMAMPPLTSASYPGASRGTATAVPTPLPSAPNQKYAAIPQPTGAFVSQEVAARDRVLEHPPGYVQNVYATEMNSSQREAALAATKTESNINNALGLGGTSSIAAQRSSSINEEGESLWDAAKKLAASVGEGLKAGESEVWRRINKD